METKSINKLDEIYKYWFPVGIFGIVLVLLYLKSFNFWIGLLIVFFGLALMITSFLKLYKIYRMKKWLKVNAKILTSYYKEWYEVDRWIKVKKYTPVLTYVYTMGHKDFIGSSIALFDISFEVTTEHNGKEEIMDFLNKYAVGKSIEIFVNPKKIEESFIYNTVHWSFLVKYILTFIIGLIMLFGMILDR